MMIAVFVFSEAMSFNTLLPLLSGAVKESCWRQNEPNELNSVAKRPWKLASYEVAGPGEPNEIRPVRDDGIVRMFSSVPLGRNDLRSHFQPRCGWRISGCACGTSHGRRQWWPCANTRCRRAAIIPPRAILCAFRAESAQEIDDKAYRQNQAKPAAADDGTSKVKPAAAEQEKQNNHE
jgi:hypothetical protein